MNTNSDIQQTDGDAPKAIVHVVDDDPQLREYVCWLLGPCGWDIRCYDDPQRFLEAYVDEGPACVITDLRMPGLSGLDLQEQLNAIAPGLPIIMMSAYADVASAVRAVRQGALDFLEKPFDRQTLIERVRSALHSNEELRRRTEERAGVAQALARLTPRQRSVLDGLLAGKPSKIIAAELGLSARTVDVHRFRLMHTLGAESLPDLFRLVMLVQGETGEHGIAGASGSETSKDVPTPGLLSTDTEPPKRSTRRFTI